MKQSSNCFLRPITMTDAILPLLAKQKHKTYIATNTHEVKDIILQDKKLNTAIQK